MSDAPDWTVAPPPQRRVSRTATALVKSNRVPADAAPELTDTVVVEVAAAPEGVAPAAETPILTVIAPLVTAPVAAEEPEPSKTRRPTLTIQVTESLRTRLRAMHRGTRNFESEDAFADTLRAALLHECERRETLYNNGLPFTGGEKPLPRNRWVESE